MAELKIKADSGGGTVSLKGPATTTSNAAVQLTLPVDDGSADQYLKTNGSGVLSWATVSTDPTTTSGTNNFTVADGDLVIGTAGHGIDFSAQTASSSGTTGNETLDHYEEGTFTPTLFFGNDTEASYNATYTSGWYVKVGRVVHAYAQVYCSSRNSSTGTVQLRGWPFNNDNSTVALAGGVVHGAWGTPSGWTDRTYHTNFDSNTKCYVRFWNGANMADLNGGHLDDDFRMLYSLTYFTTA